MVAIDRMIVSKVLGCVMISMLALDLIAPKDVAKTENNKKTSKAYSPWNAKKCDFKSCS